MNPPRRPEEARMRKNATFPPDIKGKTLHYIVTSQTKFNFATSVALLLSMTYRLTLVVEYLGWVDLDLGFSTILFGQ